MIEVMTIIATIGVSMGILFFAMLYGTVFRGWVFSKLWGWFVVSVFHVAPISVMAGVGLVLMAGFMTTGPFDYAEETDSKKKLHKAIGSLVAPFLVLLIGYVAHLYL